MKIRFSHALLAVLVHLLLGAFLFVGVQCSRPMRAPSAIQGVIISSTPPKTPPQPQPAPQPSDQQQQEQKKAEEAAQAQKRQEAEAAQRALIEQQQKQEQQRAQALAQQKAKEQAQAQRRAQEEQKKAAEAAAARKQADEARQKAAREAQEKAEAERKAKALAAAKAAHDKKVREEQLQGALAAELQQDAVDQWGAQLTAAIARAWSRLAGTDNLKCIVKMTLAPTGQVVTASIANSSGNQLFDDSVLRAVYKASPLPLPGDPTIFDPNINICFSPNPENCSK